MSRPWTRAAGVGGATRRRVAWRLALGLGLAALVAAGAAQAQGPTQRQAQNQAQGQPIVVGGRTSTEQRLLAEMTGQLLKAKGFAVDRRIGLAAAALRQAQESGQVDVSWEYTGTALAALKVADRLDAAAAYARVKELDAARGLVWLGPSRANRGQALALRGADAKGTASLSDLGARIKAGEPLRLGASADFAARPDGLGALQQAYGFEFGREAVTRMEADGVYRALRDRGVEVGLVSGTDGRVPAYGLLVLKDDKGHFPASVPAPVVRRETLDRNPRLAEVLAGLAARIDDGALSKLNAAVDVDGKGVEEVAATFLKGMALI